MWFNRRRKFAHIFGGCFPKSGSTFLSKALQGLTGYPEYSSVEEYGHNEQESLGVNSAGLGGCR